MAQVTIGGDTYDVYADVAAATKALKASMASYATAFVGTTPDNQARGLVMATQWIDSQKWIGEKSDPAQPLQWPRSGIEGVDPLEVPPQVVMACIDLAGMLVENPDLQTVIAAGGAAETKRLKAGSAEIEYFRSALAFTWKNTVFPKTVWNLLRQWLDGYGGSGGMTGAQSFDTCQPSAFDRDYGFTQGFS